MRDRDWGMCHPNWCLHNRVKGISDEVMFVSLMVSSKQYNIVMYYGESLTGEKNNLGLL